MRKTTLGIAALAALTLAAGCGKGAPEVAPVEEPAVAKGGVELSAEALKTGGVRSEAIAERTIQARLEVSGTVSVPENARAVVTPPVAGKVVRLFATVGDRVRRGQPLAEIQSGDLALANSAISAAETQAAQAVATVRQQAAAVDLAQGRLLTAQASLARQRRFASAGAFSQPTLTAARNELSEAQTEGAAARSDLAGAQSRLDRAQRLSKEGLVSKADLDQANLDVQQAQIRIERSGQRLTLAQGTLARETRIGSQGLLNAREIQAAEAEVRASKLELDGARVQHQGAQAAASGARRAIGNARSNAAALRGGGGGGGSAVTLTAPISGIVTERQATLGQAVERASDLFDIEDASTAWVTASVPEAQIESVRLGAQVSIVAVGVANRTFQGTVQVVGARIDPKTRTLPVQCRVPNPALVLRSGMSARVSLATGSSLRVLAVPRSALVAAGATDPDSASIFVKKGDKYEKRAVKTGRTEGGLVEILQGLKSGETVATAGVFVLESESRKGELAGEE